MANKRMFSKQITSSDAFVDMPATSQLLYFHLNMEADDDGFVGNPKRIIRMIGAGDDDFKILLVKRFLLPFESGVVVIKHWLLHNAVRKDMYQETQYLDEKKQLKIKENKVYTEVRNVSVTLPLHRLDQDRIDQNTIAPTSGADWNLKEEIKKLMDSDRRELRIIGWFISEKRVTLKNKEQFQTTLKRHLRASKLLIPFEVAQLKSAADNADRQIGNKWTLETLYKLLTK